MEHQQGPELAAAANRACVRGDDHLQGRRFRHAAIFERWRFDKEPLACRFDQLEIVAPFALAQVFAGERRAPDAPGPG